MRFHYRSLFCRPHVVRINRSKLSVSMSVLIITINSKLLLAQHTVNVTWGSWNIQNLLL